MESGIIELRIISCKDLKAFNFFQKLSVYALVSIVSDNGKELDEKQEQTTPTDKEGDGNPEWNHTIRFELTKALLQDSDNLFIHFDLRHEGILGFKTIGEVRVPLKDLIQESNGVIRFVIYEVRTTDGKSNGVLNFSFKVNGNGQGLLMDSPASQIAGYPVFSPPETQFDSWEAHSDSPKIQYPVLEFQNSLQETQLNHSSSSGYQDSYQGNHFLPQHAHHPPPPFMGVAPPPLPYPPPPPPPAPFAHGVCYPPPPPPAGANHWGNSSYLDGHCYSMNRFQQASVDQQLETWPNYGRGMGDQQSPSWKW